MTVPRLFVAVERGSTGFAPLIDLATRARFRKLARGKGWRWEFAEGPATHAFVVVDGASYVDPPLANHKGYPWRLDGEQPKASVAGHVPPRIPTRLWACTGDIAAGIAAARAAIGTPYDLMELGNQAAAIIQGFGFPVNYASLEPARICTTLTAKIMEACGGVTAAIGRAIATADSFPHEVARRCAGVLQEVDPVTLEPLPVAAGARVHARGCDVTAQHCACGATP